MAVIIDGREVSKNKRIEIAANVAKLKAEKGITAGLAVVIVGADPASQIYVRNKKKACEEVGINSFEYALSEETSQEELLALIDKLNTSDEVHGILVQHPMPSHIDEDIIFRSISPDKDVDAFHPFNVGLIMMNDYKLLPCTPAGVMELLKAYDIPVEGKDVVVIGRSNIVGKPQAMLMLHANATVTICHSRTKNLADITRCADIVVAAIGKAEFVKGDMIKDGCVLIDVGMNRGADNKLKGDIDFASCESKASYITPVPGGVGPMTITMLMNNTYIAAEELAK